ncbi:hypothetical protein PR202_ga07226 [Eleusine coracana subsp. coracana]|uniref:Uncharacterized protein n=1 Tax=Eleusine coracana subsp. coracana TaxID=191504 RepID=A0AAV5BZE4_ELECO|nr:hypothetical protein PR202_ga07226 [Eleusine coracana subsp. coracana]
MCGVVVQMLLFLITLSTNWNKEALKAKDRLFNSVPPADTKISGRAVQEEECSSVGKGAQGTTKAMNDFVDASEGGCRISSFSFMSKPSYMGTSKDY